MDGAGEDRVLTGIAAYHFGCTVMKRSLREMP